MTLLKQLLSQCLSLKLNAESCSLLILGDSNDQATMAQLQVMVTQAFESLILERNTYDETVTFSLPQADAATLSCSVIEASWSSLTPETLDALLHQLPHNSSLESVILLPIFNSSILAAGATPAEHARQILQHLQSIRTLAGSYAYPILLTSSYTPHLASTRLVASLLKQNGYASFVGVAESSDSDGHRLSMKIGDSEEPPRLSVRLAERWGPMMVAILAAGKSSRMGRSKQLEPVHGIPMVVKAITTAIESGADTLFLVTGAYADEINTVLQNKLLAEHPALQIIHNPHFADGQSTSVKAVANHLLGQKENIFSHAKSSNLPLDTNRFAPPVAAITFMPVDQPYLSTLTLARLFRLWQRGIQLAAPSVNRIPRGAPALFDYEFWPYLKELSGDVGAKIILRRFHEQLHTIEVAEKQLLDIDTPADIP